MPEPADPAPETEAKKSRGLGSYVVWAFVVVMVYVLSSGPVLLIRQHRSLGQLVYQVYRPFGSAYRTGLLHKPLGLYWHLWCPHRYDKNGEETDVLY